jgi:hypothetical protein
VTNLGEFSTDDGDALSSSKLDDVDTSPSEPTKVALADETSGVFVFDFHLAFTNGTFNSTECSFTVQMITDECDACDEEIGDADNLDWTAATQLKGVSYPDGLIIFVNEDDDIGEVWQINPDGTNRVRVSRQHNRRPRIK